MTCRKVHFAEIVRCKCQGGLTCFEFAVCTRLMKKPALNAKCAGEEFERGGDVRHINDCVSEFQGNLLQGA